MGLLRKGPEPAHWAWGKLRPGLFSSASSAQDTGSRGGRHVRPGLLEAQLRSCASKASGHLQAGSPGTGCEGRSC